MSKSRLTKALFALGIMLLALNVPGLFTSLRNPDIYNEAGTLFLRDITLTEKRLHELLDASPADRKAYVSLVNEAANQGIAHYWLDEGIDKYNLRVPLTENYLLYAASYVHPKRFLKYEFADYRKAVERGVGLCSQHAIVAAEILRQKGISTRIIGLTGHVVATARVDDGKNEWWILDADYGVVIPHHIEDIEKAPGIVAPYYRARGYDEDVVATLVEIYGKEGNVVHPGEGAPGYTPKKYWGETLIYVLVWLIPLALMLPALRQIFRRRTPATPDSSVLPAVSP